MSDMSLSSPGLWGRKKIMFNLAGAGPPMSFSVTSDSSRTTRKTHEAIRGKILAMKVYSDIVTKRIPGFDLLLVYRKGVGK
jgi:hypothetical protein